jgi:hypothetical protein
LAFENLVQKQEAGKHFFFQLENIEQPTTNDAQFDDIVNWMLDVDCSTFDVFPSPKQ